MAYRKYLKCELVVNVNDDGEISMEPELIIRDISPEVMKALDNCYLDWELNINDGAYIWHLEVY